MQKVAMITGAGSGIGKALSFYFAKHGWTVCALDIDEDKAQAVGSELRRLSPGSIALVADIRDEDSIGKVTRDCLSRYGRLDALVNNAGITDKKHRRITEVPLAVWQTIISTNLTGTFLMLRECAKIMSKQRWGNIINITSLLAQRGHARVGDAPYGVSKAGVEALTEYAALEIGERGINVNSVYPGVMVNTGFFDYLAPEEREKLASPTILNEVVYVLANLAPGELTGASICAKEWRADLRLKILAKKYLPLTNK